MSWRSAWRSLIIDSLKVQSDTPALHVLREQKAFTIQPGALRNPLQQQAVFLKIRIRYFSGLPQIICDAARNAGSSPPPYIPGISFFRIYPDPVNPQKILDLPIISIKIISLFHIETFLPSRLGKHMPIQNAGLPFREKMLLQHSTPGMIDGQMVLLNIRRDLQGYRHTHIAELP